MNHRRDFLAKSLLLTGAAGLAVSGLRPGAAGAQTAPRPIRRSERYDDSFISERKPFKWPGNNTLAVWFAPNVEVWQYDSAFGVGVSPNATNYVPDVYNYAWREYGMRVGLWRLADVFDQAGVKATVALNSQVCDVFPKAVEEMKKASPSIVVSDPKWLRGAVLKKFELGGTSKPSGAEREFTVTLWLADEAGKEAREQVVYKVGTSPIFTVFRAMF